MNNVYDLFDKLYPNSFDELFNRIIKELSRTEMYMEYPPDDINMENLDRKTQLDILNNLLVKDEQNKSFDVKGLVSLVSNFNKRSVFRAITIATLNHEGFNVNFVVDSSTLRRINDNDTKISILSYDDKKNITIITKLIGPPKDRMTSGFNMRRKITSDYWIDKVYVWDSTRFNSDNLRDFLIKLHTLRWNAI